MKNENEHNSPVGVDYDIIMVLVYSYISEPISANSGADAVFYTDTWYLNLDTKTWTRGPNLSQGRSSLSCSLINKPSPQIVIAGGMGTTGPSDVVDILDLETNTMTVGKFLIAYISTICSAYWPAGQ